MKGETMKAEICENCEEKIGQLEQAFVYDGHVVCEKCYRKLKTEVCINCNREIGEKEQALALNERIVCDKCYVAIPRIARLQRGLLVLILIGILLSPAWAISPQPGIGILHLIYSLCGIGVVVVLLRTMEESFGGIVLYVIFLLFPLLNLLALLFVNGSATKKLRALGYRVGFMGVKGRDLREQVVPTRETDNKPKDEQKQ